MSLVTTMSVASSTGISTDSTGISSARSTWSASTGCPQVRHRTSMNTCSPTTLTSQSSAGSSTWRPASASALAARSASASGTRKSASCSGSGAPRRLADAVKTIDADVLGLQEVDRDQPRSMNADLTAVAAEAMGAVDSQFVAALSGTPGGTWMAATGDEQPGSASYGIALLSRLPVVSWRVVRLPSLRSRVPVWFKGMKAPKFVRDEPRVAVAAVLEGPSGQFTVCNTHLSFVPGWGALQLSTLVRSLTGTREPLVLMGDLNMEHRQAVRVSGLQPLA